MTKAEIVAIEKNIVPEKKCKNCGHGIERHEYWRAVIAGGIKAKAALMAKYDVPEIEIRLLLDVGPGCSGENIESTPRH